MIRAAAVAGRFYPGDPVRLRRLVLDLLESAGTAHPSRPCALIVPHAGYVYSGPIAASAYANLVGLPEGSYRRVVILGTAHRKTLDLPAASSSDGFATPLGIVPMDRPSIEHVVNLGFAVVDDESHRQDHAIEVQLPFLQVALGTVSIAPFLVGRADPQRVAGLIEALTANDARPSLIVISADLSHYRDAEAAERLDRAAARAIVSMAPDLLGPEQACGRDSIAGLLEWGRLRGWKAELLDLRNSSHTNGSRDRVVGYGAFLFREG